MPAPKQIAFTARIKDEVDKLGILRYCDEDRERVADIIGRVTIEVYGDIGQQMVADPTLRDAGADFVLLAIIDERGILQ